MGKERIGIMGGTFDPIHAGHIRMAQHAIKEADLDRVLMLPTGNPPHKPGITPALHRWHMVCAACAGLHGLTPCREEIDREGTIYTVDTLSILHENYPRAELFYIIGADTLMELKKWREYERVLTLCRFLVCPRSSVHSMEALKAERKRLKDLGAHISWIDMEEVAVSSTEVRTALAGGQETPLLPVQVREYASVCGLYGMQTQIPQAAAWLDKLSGTLTPKRFSHTLAVAATARRLAALHGADPVKAEIAGLLHDCAKCMPLEEMQHLAREHCLTQDEEVLGSGALLHSAAGAYLARAEYGVTDPEILSAIACHTTGKPGMTRLDMAVWLADTIEPTREPYPLLEEIRALAEVSLEKALLASMEGTLSYVRKKGGSIHPATRHTVEWLRTLPENQSSASLER